MSRDPQKVMTPEMYRVTSLASDTQDTFTFELAPLHKGEVPSFQPGQFNMLYMFGVGEVPISMSGNPACRQTYVHTVRNVGHVTQRMAQLKPGDQIGVRGPFGSFWPVGQARGKDVLLIAGGIGMAPLRPVVYALSQQRQDYQRIILLYGARSAGDILYAEECRQWAERYDIDIHMTVDHAQASWQGNVGVVPDMIPRLNLDPRQTIAMICGPEIMMRFSVEKLKEKGIPLRDIFISMERNMKCAVGFCGHCQYGPYFICKDGPVFSYEQVRSIFNVPEI